MLWVFLQSIVSLKTYWLKITKFSEEALEVFL